MLVRSDQLLSLDRFIHNSLHEHADGRGIVFDKMTSAKAVCAHEHPLVQSGSEKINGDKRSTDINITIAQLLTEQQCFPAQGAVAMSGNRVAYDASDDHED
jgi:hypothetical protein